MKWVVKVKLMYRTYKFNAEIIESSKTNEKIKISGRSSSITLQNNRPFFVSKGLRHRRWDWEQVEGQTIATRSFYETLTEELERYLRSI